jgi:ankyrin repeat protein
VILIGYYSLKEKEAILVSSANYMPIFSQHNIDTYYISHTKKLLNIAGKKELKFMYSLIESGANVNAIEADGNTALHKSCMNNQLEEVKLLLWNFADPNIQNFNQMTAIDLSLYKSDIVKEIIFFQKINHLDPIDRNFLYYVYKYNYDNILDSIESGANINCQNSEGETALHYAIKNLDFPLLFILINKVSDPEIKDNSQHDAIYYAGKSENLKIIEEIDNLKRLKSLSHLEINFLNAVILGNIQSIKHYIELGVNVNVGFANKSTALHSMATNKDMQHMLSYLIEHKADVHLKDKYNFTALDYAIEDGEEAIENIKILIAAGADPSSENSEGFSYLYKAVRFNYKEILKIIIPNAKNINVLTANHNNALHAVAFHGEPEIAQLLIDNGIDIKAMNNNGETAERAISEYIRILERKENIDGYFRCTKIIASARSECISAAANNKIHILKKLKKQKLDYTDCAEKAIILAAKNCHSQVIEFLLNNSSIENTIIVQAMQQADKSQCHSAIDIFNYTIKRDGITSDQTSISINPFDIFNQIIFTFFNDNSFLELY